LVLSREGTNTKMIPKGGKEARVYPIVGEGPRKSREGRMTHLARREGIRAFFGEKTDEKEESLAPSS